MFLDGYALTVHIWSGIIAAWRSVVVPGFKQCSWNLLGIIANLVASIVGPPEGSPYIIFIWTSGV